jgi:hypothetical protein
MTTSGPSCPSTRSCSSYTIEYLPFVWSGNSCLNFATRRSCMDASVTTVTFPFNFLQVCLALIKDLSSGRRMSWVLGNVQMLSALSFISIMWTRDHFDVFQFTTLPVDVFLNYNKKWQNIYCKDPKRNPHWQFDQAFISSTVIAESQILKSVTIPPTVVHTSKSFGHRKRYTRCSSSSGIVRSFRFSSM